MRRVIIFGGYGVFGYHVARALAEWGLPLTIAGRDLRRAEAVARALGANCRALSANIRERDACRAALAGHVVAVNCAGPFHTLDATLLEACLAVGCHYTDITDDRRYANLVRSYHERFTGQGLAAVYGCSSLPGLSGALAVVARPATNVCVERARVTLFIGNQNPKGQAAVTSLLAGLGLPIAAPQGTLLGFCDREVVDLPAPFGRRAVFNFESPDYDLLPDLLDTASVAVKVGFELRLATYGFAMLAWLGGGHGPRLARLLEIPGRLVSWFGSSGGAVQVELFLADGLVRRAALACDRDGQRLAALPCALVVGALCADANFRAGAATAYEFLGAGPLLEKMVEAGFQLTTGT